MAQHGNLPGLELRSLALLRALVWEPQGRGAEGLARLEEAAKQRLGAKPLAEFSELLRDIEA